MNLVDQDQIQEKVVNGLLEPGRRPNRTTHGHFCPGASADPQIIHQTTAAGAGDGLWPQPSPQSP